MRIVNNIKELIGNTPTLRLDSKQLSLQNIEVYLKLENLNPFGSLKDRTALGMYNNIDKVYLDKDFELIEASSGNTIKALSILAGLDGRMTTSVSNRIKIQEIKDIMSLLGVNIVELPGSSPCMDPTNPEDPLYVIKDLVKNGDGAYLNLNQYFNENNPKIHYETTGKEIVDDLGKVDFLFGTLGTTGSTQGVALRLKEENPKLKTFGIATKRGDFIPGIRTETDLMEVGIYKKELYDELIFENSENAVDGVLELIKKYGVLAGPTSGAVFSSAIKKLKEMDDYAEKGSKAVLIVCDRVEWYLSYIKEKRPDLFKIQGRENSIKNYNKDSYNIKEITYNEIQKMDEKDYLLIDIRSNLAYRTGHIPNSLNIVDSLLEDLIDNQKLPFPKNKKIIISCTRGVSSQKFVSYLSDSGYECCSLQGGILRYKEQGNILNKN